MTPEPSPASPRSPTDWFSEASEARFRALVENAFAGVTVADAQGRVLYSSPSNQRILGHAPEEVHGRSGFEEVHPDDLAAVHATWARMLKNPHEEVTLQFRIQHRDGGWRWVEAMARNLLDHPEVRGVVVNWRDISARKEADEAFRQQEALLAAILEASRDGIAVEDDERLLYVNRAFANLYGYDGPDKLIGKHISVVLSPQDNMRMLEYGRQRLRGAAVPPIYEFQGLHRDGRRLYLEASVAVSTVAGKPVLVSVIRDIAERKKAEDDRRQWDRKLQEAQKLESIGVLAGGLAHDFNNLLTPVLSYASLAATTLDDDAPARPMMQEIERAARRAADLVSQMLAYAGKGKFVIEPFDLSLLVQELAPLLEALISRKAQLQLQLANGLPAVEGDPTQVRQVVMNLVTNAADSLGDLAGTVRIRTGLRYADRQELQAAQQGDNLPEGPYVFLEVVDSGCGIAPKNLGRIFEPFFTTKFAGRGLGLAAVLGIVRSHKGAVTVSSEPGRGTIFRVLFPCAPGTAPRATVPAPAAMGGQGTVLIVEDEESIRRLGRRVLEGAGFRVLEASDGQAGIEALQRAPGEIDLILLDLTMPRRGGLEIVPELRALRPDIPIILISGFSEPDIAQRFGDQKLTGYVQKPFDPAQLVPTVCRAVEQARTS